jgi:phosphoribosylglycinamide formyltransferase 2
VRVFGKPAVKGHRRMAVALAIGGSVMDARRKARAAASKIKVC